MKMHIAGWTGHSGGHKSEISPGLSSFGFPDQSDADQSGVRLRREIPSFHGYCKRYPFLHARIFIKRENV